MNIVQHSRELPTHVQSEAFVQIDDSTLDAAVDAMEAVPKLRRELREARQYAARLVRLLRYHGISVPTLGVLS